MGKRAQLPITLEFGRINMAHGHVCLKKITAENLDLFLQIDNSRRELICQLTSKRLICVPGHKKIYDQNLALARITSDGRSFLQHPIGKNLKLIVC